MMALSPLDQGFCFSLLRSARQILHVLQAVGHLIGPLHICTVPVDYDERSDVSLARIMPSASEPLTPQTCASSSRAMSISHG